METRNYFFHVIAVSVALSIFVFATVPNAEAASLLMTTDGQSSSNNSKASALGHLVTTDTLANIVATPVPSLNAFDVIWINPNLTSSGYNTLRTGVANGGSLEQYVSGGGMLVINTAGNSGNQNDIAPGAVDYDRSNIHNAETFTSPSHAYLTGMGYSGHVLTTTDFSSWSSTDHGNLHNLILGTTTILSNTDGPSFVEYYWGNGTVLLNTLTYGWGSGGARGNPQDNLINYAAFASEFKDDLMVDPWDSFVSTGEEGGPFVPNSKTYTLTNDGPNSLDWTVTVNEPWLDVTPSGGTLGPNDVNSVVVSINANADSLALGIYFDDITFSNLTSGIQQRRYVKLIVMSTDMMYWVDDGTNKIQRADLNGAIVEDLVTSGLSGPRGIAVDFLNSKMYWTDYGIDKIQRANLDGSNIEDLVTTGLIYPYGIALDVINGKMYWTDYGTNKIQRANLDGSNVEDLVTTGLSNQSGIALDVINGKMYWTDYGTDKIQRANLNGSNIEDLVTGLSATHYIALDLFNGKIYWADNGTSKIQRANLDGSNVEDIVTGLSGPFGITLDVQRGKVYWTDWSANVIQRANLDGSNVEDLVTGLSNPADITIPQTTEIDDLEVTPFDSFNSEGNEGGPFTPADKTYTLTNNGPNSLDWTATVTEPWLDVTPSSGASGPNDINSVVVSINANANSLALGIYFDDITFSNLTSGIQQRRYVKLIVMSTDMMYWVDDGTNKIQRADLNGSIVEDLVTSGLSTPRGIAVDISNYKMYWTDTGIDKIKRANLDGSNIEDLVTTGLSGTWGIALNASNGKMYWTDYGTNKIQRANLDGSNIEDLVTTGLSNPSGIALDVINDKMYWTDYGNNKIQRANLDGSNVEDLVAGLDEPYYIALDLFNGKMYWADYSAYKIQRANLDGSNIEDIVTGLSGPIGITLDRQRGKVYWADWNANKIQRANLDGSNIEDLVTGLSDPAGIAIPQITEIDDLVVTPFDSFNSEGNEGGPFSPASKIYTLTNNGPNSLDWTATVTEPWLDVTPSGGTLPGSTFTTVDVSINIHANTLPVGIHTDKVTFSNLTSGINQSRFVKLLVGGTASIPFVEDFEAGPTLLPYWEITGTNNYRTQVTTLNTPHGGSYHVTMDSIDGYSRNELTLTINLENYEDVQLMFWAKEFGDEPEGPPPTPFFGGYDFDGVAISEDGHEWYEVQDLRSLTSSYTQIIVDLDAAVATYGLNYNERFKIRFNQYDDNPITTDGIALDDIEITGKLKDDLLITPPEDFNSAGGEGGPFTPADKTYTLTNNGPNSLDWTAAVTKPWLDITPGSGTLADGASTTVDVCINDNANTLPQGNYNDTATFTNITSGIAQMRQVELSVRGIDHFEWDNINSPQEVNVPFPVKITAKDSEGFTVTKFTGTAELIGTTVGPGCSTIVITECCLGPDFIEIQNVSEQAVDTTGWVVAISDDYHNINIVNPVYWYLPASIPAGSVSYKTDNAGDNYWGSNIFWNPGDNSWAIIVDDMGNVVDFVAWGWSATGIASMNTIINGHSITIGSEWSDAGVSSSGSESIQRQGNEDRNNSSDFSWISPSTKGIQNPGLSVPFGGGLIPIPISPASTGNFTAGVWEDEITVHQIATQIILKADDGSGHVGNSNVFEVVTPSGEIEVTDSIPPPNDLNLPFGDVFIGGSRVEGVTITNIDPNHPLIVTDISLGGEYFEDFDDGLAQNWEETPEVWWEVVNGEYRCDSGGSIDQRAQSLYTGDTWQDCSAQVIMRRTGYMSSAVRLPVRVTEGFDYPGNIGSAYMVAISGNGNYYVGKYVNGSFSFIQGWTASPYLNPGEAPNLVMINIEGSVISAYLNGNLAWSGTDSSITEGGKIGLLVYTGSVTINYFDDVLVGEPINTLQTISAEQQWYNDHPYENSKPETAPEDWEPPEYLGEDAAPLKILPVRSEKLSTNGGFRLENVPDLSEPILPFDSISFDVVFEPLEEGEYESAVVIISNDTNEPNVAVQLSGRSIPEYLEIIPEEVFEFSGHPGGPFVPSNTSYQLTNTGPVSVDWIAEPNVPWLDVSPSSGTLGSGKSTTVVVTLNSQADTMPEGYYCGDLITTDITTTVELKRRVCLNVYTEPKIWVSPHSFDVTVTQGANTLEKLTIGNSGDADLDYELQSISLSFIPSVEGIFDNNESLELDEEYVNQLQQIDVNALPDLPYLEDELLVRFAPDKNKVLPNEAKRGYIVRQLVGASHKKSFKIVPGLSVVKLPKDISVAKAIEKLQKSCDILYVQLNYELHALETIPNDTSFSNLWGLHNTGQTGGTIDADIDAPEAWDIETGTGKVIVAVIDTGVDYTHPDLAGNMWVNEDELNGTPGVDDDGNGFIDDIYGYDFVNNDGDPIDDHYHGTHCAGTIGAVGNNALGVVGVCWDVEIMAVKFLNSSGNGSTADAISSVEYAMQMGARVMSNSWGGGAYNQALKDAIDAAGQAGIIFVAAAGNDNANNDLYPHYPSSYTCENIIAVMATDHYDNRSSFSSYGSTSVDIGAPGSDIYSCSPGSNYRYLDGTSMAAPHVSGACALLLSVNPQLSYQEVKEILLQTVDPTLPGLCLSGGRLNLYQAIPEVTYPSWISFDITEGIIPPGDENDVVVIIDGNEAPGVHEGEIIVYSNDPYTPELVRVRMTVIPHDFFTEKFEPNDPFDPNDPNINDMSYSQIVFIPNGFGDYLTPCNMSATEFPVDSNGAVYITLADDDYQVVDFGGETIQFYGDTYDRLYIGSNGYVTFDSGDTHYMGTFDEHFNMPRISALFDDLSPNEGGSIWYKFTNKGIVITFEDVPEYSLANSNSFQIELRFNGKIRITWLGIDAYEGIVGLSEGVGVPPYFRQSDLSEYDICEYLCDLNKDLDVDFCDLGMFAQNWRDSIPGPANVAHWMFDETSGHTAYDSSGNNHTATLENEAKFAKGLLGNAVEFDGMDDRVWAGTFDVNSSYGYITITAWVKADDFDTGDAPIIVKTSGNRVQDHVWMLGTVKRGGINPRFCLRINGSTTSLVARNVDLVPGVWTHLAASWDGITMKLYSDGVLVESKAKNGIRDTENVEPVIIGNLPQGIADPTEGFDGLIDDVRIYNWALSETEIESIYNSAFGSYSETKDFNSDCIINESDLWIFIQHWLE